MEKEQILQKHLSPNFLNDTSEHGGSWIKKPVYTAMQDYADQQSLEVAKRQWISVADRLPEEGKRLLLWRIHLRNPLWNTHRFGHYSNGKFYAVGGFDSCVEEITHWQSLPEAPIIEEVKTKQP